MDSKRASNKTAKSQQTGHPCIWMQAGVVRHKPCRIDYHCEACRFDAAMHRMAAQNRQLRQEGKMPEGRRGKIVFWKDRLRELHRSAGPRGCT